MTRIVFISSGGGHLYELLQLQSLFTVTDSVLISEKKALDSSLKRKLSIPTYYLRAGTRARPISYFVTFIWNTLYSFFLFLRLKPNVIITTGAHTAIPFCFWGFLFRREIIFIESIARVKSASLSGRILQHLKARIYVQWPSMLEVYSHAQYVGQLLSKQGGLF